MSLYSFAKDHKIKYFLISFTDICGITRSKLIPATAISSKKELTAGFAGFAAHLDLSPADPDIIAKPDSERAIILPWQPEVAWVPSDIYIDNQSLEQTPRNTLKRVIKIAEENGIFFKTGVEPEFLLLNKDSHQLADPYDNFSKPCYDQQALFRNIKFISRINDYMEQLGWNPYQADHEDANGQYEMNWDYSDCLTTADRHCFFKFMVQTIAEQEGYMATFMPKPFAHLTGNGCHLHFSVWNKANKNLFQDSAGEFGLSSLAYHFLGGIMHSGRALTAITCPTVNSYKRIHTPPPLSGASWSPSTVTFAGNNRTHMIRIPDNSRIEYRLPDGSTNPYLLQAFALAAGLEGIKNNRNPGEKQTSDSYQSKSKSNLLLPFTLKEALLELETSSILKDYIGESSISSFVKLKELEWQTYCKHVSKWEIQYYKNI